MKDAAKVLLEKALQKTEIESSPNVPIIYGRKKLTDEFHWVTDLSESKDLAVINYCNSSRLSSVLRKYLVSSGCLHWGSMYFSHSSFLENFENTIKEMVPPEITLLGMKRKDGYEYLVISPETTTKFYSGIYDSASNIKKPEIKLIFNSKGVSSC